MKANLVFALMTIVLLIRLPSAGAQQADAPSPLDSLAEYLALNRSDRPLLAEQSFAHLALDRSQTQRARQALISDREAWVRESRAAEIAAGEIAVDDLRMRFSLKMFGERPAQGRSLYISLHGGGSMPAEVNDKQWENQKRLYSLEEGIYLVPRAPTDAWNMWHQAHIDRMFARLIEDLIVLEGVDPNRVYLLGYSAGGDGVFQLAPRMADRLAAAAMMAGHPNETVPLGLRNLGFTLHMGENDAAFDRNKIAQQWKVQLEELRAADPGGYPHAVAIHAGKGHWMDREDTVAIPWMAKFTRNPWPDRVVWKQDDVTHSRFYWLGVNAENERGGSLVTARVKGQTIEVEQADGVRSMRLWLADELIDLDQPIRVEFRGQELFAGKVPRTIAVIEQSLQDYDRAACASASLEVPLPAGVPPR
jgi:pimeloyl-ACP methyl ester carboxylesterase